MFKILEIIGAALIANGAPIASPKAPSPAALATSFATFSLGSNVSETNAPAAPPAPDPTEAFANAFKKGRLLIPTILAIPGKVNPPAAIEPAIEPPTSVSILPKFGPSAYSCAALSATISLDTSVLRLFKASLIFLLSSVLGVSPSISTIPNP